MRIVFAAPENAWGGFLGVIRNKLPQHEFIATGRFGVDSLAAADVLIPTMCPVTRSLLAGADRLKLVQQCGSGLEGVDIQAASDLGIAVANVPTEISGNADSVAEVGIYLMIGLARNVRGMARSLMERKMGEPKGMAVKGRTAGLIGLGGIGRALIRRLKGFDMQVMGIRRHRPQAALQELGLDWAGGPDALPVLLQRADFVFVCLPMTPANRHLIDAEALAHMQPHAFLINLARGGLVDREALLKALEGDGIAGAGLDVFWEEPPDPGDPIFHCNVLATPHIAGSTDLSMEGIAHAVANNIQRVENGRKPLYCATP
jgi:phosphoglycerate dehydrogenase-like enzyme